MKRYWKLIAIVTIVVLSIGTFYIQSALSASSYSEVIIKKESGNAELIEPVTLNGYYYVGNSHQPLTLTSEESTFRGEQSFFERLRGFYSPQMNQLQDEYRGFMRGKSGIASAYLNSGDVLAYANVVNQTFDQTPSEMEFDIAVLNKESDKTMSFSLAVPNRALYTNAHVVDVQMVDGDLKVLTQNRLKPTEAGLNSHEIHMYSFNLDAQDINGDNEITIIKSKDTNVHSYTSTVREMNPMSPHKQLVFFTEKEKNGPKGIVEESNQEYFVYNFADDKKEIIEIPEKLQNIDGEYSFDGENLYTVAGQEKVSLFVYNLKSKRIVNEIEMESTSRNALISAIEGKLYMLQTLETTEIPELFVYDVKTGDKLYKGKITTKEPVKGDAFFNFHKMNVN